MANTGFEGNRVRIYNSYSLAFKLQVVNEVEKGELTYQQAQLRYGIKGKSSVLHWLRKHGRLDWSTSSRKDSKPAKAMARKTPNKQIQELQKKIKLLQQEKEILNIAIDTADEMFGTEIRKKYLPLSRQNAAEQKGAPDSEEQSE